MVRCCPDSTARHSRGLEGCCLLSTDCNRWVGWGGGGGGGGVAVHFPSMNRWLSAQRYSPNRYALPVRTEPVPDEVREPGPHCHKRNLTLCHRRRVRGAQGPGPPPPPRQKVGGGGGGRAQPPPPPPPPPGILYH